MEKPSENVLETSDDIPATMRVESSVLEPLTISSTGARFVFENKGILSRDTCLQFDLVVPNFGVSGKAFLPLGCGIYSLIKKATLRVGAKRICVLDDLAFLRSITHAYDTPSYRSNYTRIMKGINNTLSHAQVASGQAPAPNTNIDVGKFQPTAVKYDDTGQPETSTLSYDMALTNDETTTPSWTIYLRELFPILDSIELPLFLMNEEVAVDLEFNVQTNGIDAIGNKSVGTLCCFEGDDANPPVLNEETCSLVLNSCVMYVDTIYYANERMELIDRQVDATKGMSLNYTDVINNVASIPQVTPASLLGNNIVESEVVHQIPLSGFAVKNLFWAYTTADRNSPNSGGAFTPAPRFHNPLFGKYSMLSTPKSDSWDIRVNDQLVYPETITNPALKACEARQVYNSPVYLHNALYSGDSYRTKAGKYPINPDALPFSDSVTSVAQGGTYRLFRGINATELAGNQHFAGVNLSVMPGDANDDTIFVNQKPIEVLHRKFPVNEDTNYNYSVRYFAEVVKRFALKNGSVVIAQGPSVALSQ